MLFKLNKHIAILNRKVSFVFNLYSETIGVKTSNTNKAQSGEA